nr:MAG TPA: tail completion protein [Caudoviricetes sp.]
MDKLLQMLKDTGVPFAYDHFAEGEAVGPPFLCYLLPGSHNFAADGKVYHKVSIVHLELYTDEKNPSLEQTVETVLDASEVFYDKTEVWIGSEKLYEVLYTFEMEV